MDQTKSPYIESSETITDDSPSFYNSSYEYFINNKIWVISIAVVILIILCVIIYYGDEIFVNRGSNSEGFLIERIKELDRMQEHNLRM
jgi:hypothetical protein